MNKSLLAIGRSIVSDTGVAEKDPRRLGSALVFKPGEHDPKDKTRRIFRPTAGLPPFGIPMPGIAEAILDQEDKRLWRLKGAVTAALGTERGVVLVSSLHATAPVGRVAAGLAAAMILSERRPLVLLDLEYHEHTLQRIAGITTPFGLPDVLRGQYGLSELVASSRDPRVGFLGGGTRRPGLWELGSLKAGEILSELVQAFDLLIAAMPPGDDGTSEVMAAAASAMGLKVLGVLLAPAEEPDEITRFANMLEVAGGRLLGWVLT